jgi:uncharacterized protein
MGWVLLLLRFPDSLNGATRASVRLAIWLGTAFAFVRLLEKIPFLKYLKLNANIRRGFLWGLSFSAFVLVPSCIYRVCFSSQEFHWPSGIATWLNPVLTAPLCEEILFRGIAFQELKRRLSFLSSATVSSLLFALIHLPYWYLSGNHMGWALAASLAVVFIQGCAFSWLLERSKSLWAPLTFHWLNNLVGQSFA